MLIYFIVLFKTCAHLSCLQIPIIRSVTKSEVVEFYQGLFDPSSASYRKLSVRVEGHANYKVQTPPTMQHVLGVYCYSLYLVFFELS